MSTVNTTSFWSKLPTCLFIGSAIALTAMSAIGVAGAVSNTALGIINLSLVGGMCLMFFVDHYVVDKVPLHGIICNFAILILMTLPWSIPGAMGAAGKLSSNTLGWAGLGLPFLISFILIGNFCGNLRRGEISSKM